MAKELSEESKFQISIKTLVTIVVAIVSIVSAYFGLMASINSKFADLEVKVNEALEKPNLLLEYLNGIKIIKEYINEEDYPREYYINQYIQTLFDGGKKYTLLQRYNILKDYISYYDSQELGITSDIGIGIFNKVNQKYITLLLRNKLDLINDEKNEYMNKINTQNSKNELKRYGEYDNINDSIVKTMIKENVNN